MEWQPRENGVWVATVGLLGNLVVQPVDDRYQIFVLDRGLLERPKSVEWAKRFAERVARQWIRNGLYILDRVGCPTSPREKLRARIYEMWHEGEDAPVYTVMEIARQCGVTRRAVRHLAEDRQFRRREKSHSRMWAAREMVGPVSLLKQD